MRLEARAALLWLMAARPIEAWDADGHGAIGMTCMSAIKTGALTQLKRLLGGKDIVDISPWSFQLLHRYPELERIYYQSQTRDMTAGVVNCEVFNPTSNCAEGRCLVGALSHYFNQFMGATEQSTPSLQYKAPINLKLSDSDYVRLIVSLVGELHSVSKFGYTNDDNGKAIPISFVDSTKKIETTLYEYWNSVLVQKTIKDRPHFWFSGWTHMNNLSRHSIAQEEALWQKTGNKTEVFEQWARDTFRDSCSHAYRIRSKQAVYSRLHMQLRTNEEAMRKEIWPREVTGGEMEANFQFKKDYIMATNHIFADFDLIKHKILIGGLRLSLVLNHILSHKDAKKLRAGSAIQLQNVPAVQSGSGIWSGQSNQGGLESSSRWTTNLVINLGIIGLLVLGFLAFLNLTGEKVATVPRRGLAGETKVKD